MSADPDPAGSHFEVEPGSLVPLEAAPREARRDVRLQRRLVVAGDEAQIAAVVELSRDICARHAIPPARVLAHSDIAPGRKIDPGERFDWPLLFRNGVGHWVPPGLPDEGVLAGQDLIRFQRLLKDYGYGLDVTGLHDEGTRKVTDAFQRHFRPALVNGVPDISCLRTVERLLA